MSNTEGKPASDGESRELAPDSGQAQEPQGTGRPTSHPVRVLLGAATLAVIAAGLFGYWYFFMRGIVYSDDARLAGHLVDLAPEISGKLVAVLVREGQFVRRSEPVFRLDDPTQQAAVAQSQATLSSAKANLAVSQAQCERAVNGPRPEEIKAAEAMVKRLESEEDLARLEAERTARLTTQGAATQDEKDRAQAAYDSARHGRENAAHALALLQQGSREEDIAAAKAAVELARSRVAEAQAALESAQSDLDRCSVAAPFDGWVVRRWLDPGATPLPGQPVVSVFDPATLRVDANIDEKYLNEVAVGNRVDVEVDAYPKLRLTGRVAEILRATNSQFSLIPAEGVSGTFIKVTQRVPLRIAIQAPPGLHLGPGLSAEVRIHRGSSAGEPEEISGEYP